MSNLILGNEKAIVGGLGAGVVALLGQVGVNSQITVKEAIYAVVTWVVTHILVYVTTNSPKSISPTPPVVTPTPPTA